MILTLVRDTSAHNMAMVELDLDPAAERYAALDRRSLMPFFVGPAPTGNAKIRVPIQYTIDHNLMVLILDDSGEPSYYVSGNDKHQAMLVDARTVQLNP